MYALIKWGGQVAGQRPRTVLAYVWAVNDAEATGWMADIVNSDGTSKYKKAKKISRDDILYQFFTHDMPLPRQVREAKANLSIVE